MSHRHAKFRNHNKFIGLLYGLRSEKKCPNTRKSDKETVKYNLIKSWLCVNCNRNWDIDQIMKGKKANKELSNGYHCIISLTVDRVWTKVNFQCFRWKRWLTFLYSLWTFSTSEFPVLARLASGSWWEHWKENWFFNWHWHWNTNKWPEVLGMRLLNWT